MSTLKVNTIQNASGVEKYLCQAWVNFNGTGTVAIRASGNVSSITDNGTGDYTVNFTNAMPDANYTIVANGTSNNTAGTGFLTFKTGAAGTLFVPSTTGFTSRYQNGAASYVDPDFCFVAIFR